MNSGKIENSVSLRKYAVSVVSKGGSFEIYLNKFLSTLLKMKQEKKFIFIINKIFVYLAQQLVQFN